MAQTYANHINAPLMHLCNLKMYY